MAKQINLFSNRKKVETDKDRAARAAIYSTARWHRLRKSVLNSNPICSCGEIDDFTGLVCERAANEVHHKIDVKEAPALIWEVSNLQSMNKACHSRITAKRQREGL